MKNMPLQAPLQNSRGVVLVAVLLIVAIFFVAVVALLFESGTEVIVAANEHDYVKSLGFAEAGMAWAQRRAEDQVGGASDFTDFLDGPNNASAADDNLPGLRDLSLTAVNQLHDFNAATKSAIVARDFFGDGSLNYEAIRIDDENNKRALVYVRLDDNFDDDPDDPSNNDPLTDTDRIVRATAISEYPVFVDGSGVAQPTLSVDRGMAVRALVAEFGVEQLEQPAILTEGDLDISGNPGVCGACGSVHTNSDLDLNGNPSICVDATATGSFSGSTSGIGGQHGGGFPRFPVPVINPYHSIFVPPIAVFDTTGLGVPAELQCGPPTAADPGNSKYFAMVADDADGLVFKAYWDFTNDRWTWVLIDDLSDATDVKLDDCGRAPSDPSYGTGVSDRPGFANGRANEFYGFKLFKVEDSAACSTCGSAGSDVTLCVLSNNDFAGQTYWDASSGTPVGQNATTQATSISGSNITVLPGGADPDGTMDFDPENRMKDGTWTISSNTVFSPVYNAVVWIYGTLDFSGNVGSGKYCSSVGCGGNGSVPNDTWMASFIVHSDIDISGTPSYSPANTQAGYWFLLVAGRDIELSGNVGPTSACSGGSCPGTPPSSVGTYAGIIVAHEQIQISGNPQVIGFIIAEDAVDCSPVVAGGGSGVSTLNGNPNVYYDCNIPPSPWSVGQFEVRSWQEVE